MANIKAFIESAYDYKRGVHLTAKKEKTFCNRCKYLNKYPINIEQTDHGNIPEKYEWVCTHKSNCELVEKERDSWFSKGNVKLKYIKSPQELNKNNDCKNFEE